MKNLICITFLLLSCILLPSVAFSQHHVEYRYPTPTRVYPGYTYRCYTVLLPYLHERCEYVRVYTPSHTRHLPPNHHRQHIPPPPRRSSPPPHRR